MELEDRNRLAALLRRAAAQTISETQFWAEVRALSERVGDPVMELALETATHYWGNFHARSILLIPKKPNRGQLQQGKNEMDLIAQALESGWDFPILEEKLKNI